MARTTKKQETVKEAVTVVTRAEKKDATKNLIRELLAAKPLKHNELIDEVAKLYTERFGEGTDNINDTKGRVGSVLDIMKKESDVMYDGGMYALKARALPEAPEKVTEEAPVKKTRGRKKAEEKTAEPVQEEKPVKKTVRKTKTVKAEKAEETEKTEEKTAPLPPAPLQPIAPTAPVTPEVAPEPIPEDKPAPKKRGRKPKAKAAEIALVQEEVKTENEVPKVETTAEVVVETEAVVEEIKAEEMSAPVTESVPVAEEVKPAEEVKEEPQEEPKAEEVTQLVVKEKAEMTKPVMDMSFLFGAVKPAKASVREERKEAVKTEAKPEVKAVERTSETPAPRQTQPKERKEEKTAKPEAKLVVKTEKKTESKPEAKEVKAAPVSATNVRKLPKATVRSTRKTVKPLTADEKLCEAFLKKIRSLGGDYFEYYSVYLLERYSMKNGRRLEGMKISGGDHDGGIDGEIELTDKLGFKETIYIQSKNWNPEKGDEKLWVVGETLLQQFIGACACRQAKEGKQNCRGIFITTSRFTPEAKRLLDDMSDKIVGYDGNDLYEAAKECAFGVIEKNGEWTLDERLLSGSKAFFNLY